MFSKAELQALDRPRLLRVAAELGLSGIGKPDSVLIMEILMRQGEIAGRAATPVELRLARLEDLVAELAEDNARCMRALAELVFVLAHMPGPKIYLGERLMKDADHFRDTLISRGMR